MSLYTRSTVSTEVASAVLVMQMGVVQLVKRTQRKSTVDIVLQREHLLLTFVRVRNAITAFSNAFCFLELNLYSVIMNSSMCVVYLHFMIILISTFRGHALQG